MRLKLCCLLMSCLLVCLSACASNNSANPQAGGTTTSTNSTTSQTVVTQPSGSANEAGSAPGAPPSSAENQPPVTGGIDACSLLTTKEVADVQGGAIKDTKANQRNDGEFLMSQCFYTAEEFVRSVSLSVVQQNPANPNKQPKDYFTEKFRDAGKKEKSEREKEREKEREREREREKAKEQKGKGESQAERGRGEEEEEEEGANVERVSGVGEQAYWVKTGPSAALYVLKKNQFLILSIGGGDAEPIKLKKTKALAQQALKRLK